jgi:hypothetical protein
LRLGEKGGAEEEDPEEQQPKAKCVALCLKEFYFLVSEIIFGVIGAYTKVLGHLVEEVVDFGVDAEKSGGIW